MSPLDIAFSIAVALTIGILIGGVGVGGVLLVPWLVHGVGLSAYEAIGIAMLSFVLPGSVALVVAMRSSRRLAANEWRLVVATVPGALAGAVALSLIPERVVFAVLAAAVLHVGIQLLLVGNSSAPSPIRFANMGPDWPSGLFVGFASAITGTGGPMVLAPLVLSRGVPLLEAVALSQLVQLPIAALATAGNLMTRGVDVGVGLAFGALLVPGVLVGQSIARRIPRQQLGIVMGIVLIAAGATFAFKATSAPPPQLRESAGARFGRSAAQDAACPAHKNDTASRRWWT